MKAKHDEKTVAESLEEMETQEGQERALQAVQEYLTTPKGKETLAGIGDTMKGLYKLFSSLGKNLAENKSEILSFIDFVEKVSSMEEDEAKAYIEGIWNEAEIGLSKEEAEEIIEQVYKRPKSLVMPTTKVTTQIFEKHETALATVVSGRKKNEVIVPFQVFVGIDEQTGVKLPQNLTAYDREVHNGLCSIAEAGYTFCTSKQIYEAMAGKPSKSPQAEAHVTRSMRKMMTTLISIDWTEHAKMKGIGLKEGEGLYTEQNMIYAQSAYAIINGQKVQGYKLLRKPVLLEYAKTVGQLTTIDRKYIQLQSVSNTENSIVLKNYIIRRIETMKNPHNKIQNTILFDTMFTDCGITGNYTQMNRHRNTVYSILKELQGLEYIKTYKEKKKGQQHIGVEIEL